MKKNPYGKILKGESKEHYLNTVTKSYYSLRLLIKMTLTLILIDT